MRALLDCRYTAPTSLQRAALLSEYLRNSQTAIARAKLDAQRFNRRLMKPPQRSHTASLQSRRRAQGRGAHPTQGLQLNQTRASVRSTVRNVELKVVGKDD